MNPLQTQINELQNQVATLSNRLVALESRMQGAGFEELIRDITFYDVDNTTTTVQASKVTNVATVAVDVPKNPTKYIRAYFRGQPYNIPVYAIT